MLRKILIRGLYGTVLLLCIAGTAGISLLLESKQYVFDAVLPNKENVATFIDTSPFPVSVDPVSKTMADVDLLQNSTFETLAAAEEKQVGWKSKLVAFLFKRDWYQNLASPVSRVIVVWPGERKEEVVQNVGDVMRWSIQERNTFASLIESSVPAMDEGKYYPGKYVTHREQHPKRWRL